MCLIEHLTLIFARSLRRYICRRAVGFTCTRRREEAGWVAERAAHDAGEEMTITAVDRNETPTGSI